MAESDDPMSDPTGPRTPRVRRRPGPGDSVLRRGGALRRVGGLAAALACVLACHAPAARADDLATLKAELEGVKSDYAAKIAALEARIAELEAKAATAATQASAPPPAPAPAGRAGGTGTAFNPAMSVILAGTYVSTSADPASYRIAGFVPTGGDAGPGTRSFNLGESELTFSSNVDPYFFANLTASVTADNSISVEEAYFRTTALSGGFTIKGGRFFGAVGYLNEVHAHAWDFVDQPLVYQAFLGGQMAEDGIQAKWLAPTDLFLEVGVETGNGDAFPGTRRDRNGPNGGAVFAHVGDDIGDSASWRAGLSWLDRSADGRGYADVDATGQPVTNAFTGSSHILVADAIFKWAPHGNPTVHALKLQAEYLRRTEAGTLAFDTAAIDRAGDYRAAQSGWYLQGVYQFRPRWRAGMRYDALDSGSTRIGLVAEGVLPAGAFPALAAASPHRVTWMLDWSPSEFSRIRGQFALDDARATQRDRQLLLQYLYSIGAHGAHKF